MAKEGARRRARIWRSPSAHEQTPAYYDGLTNDSISRETTKATATTSSASTPKNGCGRGSGARMAGIDKASAAELRAFLQHYPSSRQAKYAQARLEELNKPKKKRQNFLKRKHQNFLKKRPPRTS